MIRNAIALSMTCLTISVCSLLAAATIHIKWDPSITGGYYRITGRHVDFSHAHASKQDLSKHRHEDLTADLPDGPYHLDGPGFSDTFHVRDGKITFRENVPSFSSEGGTITFNTAVVKIDLNGYAQDVSLEGATPILDKATRIHTLKVVCGHQKLDYGGGVLTVAIDAKGNVRLPDNPGGFTVEGGTVRLEPRQYTFQPAANVAGWGLGRAPDLATGPQTIKLLPTTGRYLLTVVGAGERPSKFDLRINSSFQVATRSGGQYAECAEVKPEGGAAPLMSVSLLGGQQIVKDRLAAELAARQVYLTVSRDSLAVWHQDFKFDDALQVYPFPEQLVAYRVKFPAGKVRASELALLALDDPKAVSLPWQLSDVVQSGGFLEEAIVQFRADLPLGQKRLYRLTAGYQAPRIDASPLPIRIDAAGENTAKLVTDRLQVQVPAGRLDFKPAKPLAQIPAPILGLTRIGGAAAPAVTGAFVAPSALVVDSMEANLLETGPLLARYRVAYHLPGNKTYEVTLTLRTAESYITVDEKLAGFSPDDGAFWQVRFASLHPTLRQAMSNGGYERYAGSYDKDAEPTGKLPFILGLYGPNSLGVVRSAAFWDESGPDALLVCLNRLRNWQTNKREIWITRGPDMLQFFARNQGQYFRARLEGAARYWALGLVAREAMVNRPVIDTRSKQVRGAGPEVRLCQKLGDFSLDIWKDRIIDFDEKLDAGPFADQEEVSYDQWIKSHGNLAKLIANQYWDSGATGAPDFKGAAKWFGSYARSRVKWTAEQRRRVRALLLFCAYVCEDDNGFPHHSMLAGHPNFIADVKGALAVACETFPNHPDVKRWRDSFMGYLTEWLNTFQRSADPEHNARGGRWTENIAGYSGTSLRTLLGSYKAMAAYDGTDLINSTHHVADWVRWYRDAIMSPHDGQRLVPPQGAHSHAFEADGPKSLRDSLFEVAALLAKSNPQLASEMLWIKTNGKEGTNPKAASCLYVDYGPIFHYDFGGPNESYATMQNIAGRLNYRWKAAGIVYYGAKGKVWSYNGANDNGDQFSWNKLSAFSIQGEGLNPSPSKQLLYDFGFAQFCRIQGEAPYLARGLLLVRDDYIALCDEVSPGAPAGQFIWASLFQMPQIYQLKPGAATIETTSSEGSLEKGPPLRISHQRKYVGKGDFLTIVAPAAVQAQAQPFGATVNGEYVFASQKSEEVKEAAVVFSGNYGYARPNQLALFQGTRIGLGGFELRREGGDFGLSAALEKNRIVGRIVGRSGGKVLVVPPGGLDPATASVTVNGKPVSHTVQEGAITFLVDIAQKDGRKDYEIQFVR